MTQNFVASRRNPKNSLQALHWAFQTTFIQFVMTQGVMTKSSAHLEVFKVFGPLQRPDWIPVINPGCRGSQHETETPREAACVILSEAEFIGIDCSLYGSAGEALPCALLKLAQN